MRTMESTTKKSRSGEKQGHRSYPQPAVILSSILDPSGLGLEPGRMEYNQHLNAIVIKQGFEFGDDVDIRRLIFIINHEVMHWILWHFVDEKVKGDAMIQFDNLDINWFLTERDLEDFRRMVKAGYIENRPLFYK